MHVLIWIVIFECCPCLLQVQGELSAAHAALAQSAPAKAVVVQQQVAAAAPAALVAVATPVTAAATPVLVSAPATTAAATPVAVSTVVQTSEMVRPSLHPLQQACFRCPAGLGMVAIGDVISRLWPFKSMRHARLVVV